MQELSRNLNILTGYDQVALLKAAVEERETEVAVAHAALTSQKRAYDGRLKDANRVSRDLHGLLQRKASWNEKDVTEFLALTKQEHAIEAAVTAEKVRGEGKEGSEGYFTSA